MNIYSRLNEAIEYIESNIDDEISYNKLAQILCVNQNAMKYLFTYICGISINEYIRKRRLSLAAYDLIKEDATIMDIALKYGYDNATAFSRAFTSFHGTKPSLIKKEQGKIKNFPKIVFETKENDTFSEIDYQIIALDTFTIFGKGIKTDYANIGKDAPAFFREMQSKYSHNGKPDYGMIIYENRRESNKCEYVVAWKTHAEDLAAYKIPESKWLSFKINSSNEKEIQSMSRRFYSEFLPSNKYILSPLPEIEYYHDGITEFLVPIKN